VLAIGTLLMAAPLATAAMVEGERLMPKAHEEGYLLYPRSSVCTPAITRDVSDKSAAAVRRHRILASLRARGDGSDMPPDLGGSLDAKWLTTGQPGG